MNLRDLIREIHRRTLWQVLGVFLGASWIVLEVVDQMIERLSLPDWIYGFAIVLLLIGLPVVLATAFMQEGGPSVSPERHGPGTASDPGDTGDGEPASHKAPAAEGASSSLGMRLFTWRNAILGGIGALALWGAVAVGGLLARRASPETPAAGAPAPIRSVAVLPFANMSADPDNEYFADGLAEELLNVLSKVEALKVAARTSAFAFKGQDVDVREVGETLGVEAVVEGSVRKQRDRVRITAQLVQASDGFHLWSDTYEGDLADVFALQDSVARAIAGELRVTLGVVGRSQRERGLTESVDAYEFYLLGRHRWGQRGDPAAIRGAVDSFQRAVEADPEFALAYSGLADAWVLMPLYERTADRLASFARAREAARRALELSPTEPEVLATAGWVAYLADWDADRAGELLDRAVRLGPSYVWGVNWRSMLHFSRGRHAAAVMDARRARELDPLSPVVAYANASILLAMDSVEAAFPLLEQVAHSSTPAPFWLRTYGEQLAVEGRVDETLDVWAQWARTLGYSDVERVRSLWADYPLWGSRSSPLDVWEEDEAVRAWGWEWRELLDDVLARTGADAADLSFVWAWAGPEAMLDAAEIMVEEHSIWAIFLNHGALYRPLADDPRYQALLRRVGLPPPQGL